MNLDEYGRRISRFRKLQKLNCQDLMMLGLLGVSS